MPDVGLVPWKFHMQVLVGTLELHIFRELCPSWLASKSSGRIMFRNVFGFVSLASPPLAHDLVLMTSEDFGGMIVRRVFMHISNLHHHHHHHHQNSRIINFIILAFGMVSSRGPRVSVCTHVHHCAAP